MKIKNLFIGAIAVIGAGTFISLVVDGVNKINKEKEEVEKIKQIEEDNKKPASVYLDSLIATERTNWRDSLERFYPGSRELAVADSLREARMQKYYDTQRAAVKKLKKSHDDVEKITWFSNSSFTHYNNINGVSFYFGYKEGRVWLRLKISYFGEDWIFFEKIKASYSGETKEILFQRMEKETEVGGGDVWEWIDISGDGYEDIFRRMADKKEGILRLDGKYRRDRKITSREHKAILQVLDGYRGMKRLLENNQDVEDLVK